MYTSEMADDFKLYPMYVYTPVRTCKTGLFNKEMEERTHKKKQILGLDR